jgi:aldose 1-epimerase
MAREGQERRKILTQRIQSLHLAAGRAEIALLPALGGSIVGFTLAGRPILRPTVDAAIADGNVRLASSYPLVPYSNRIRDARLTFGGNTLTLARNFGDSPHSIHGVGWQRPWHVDSATQTRATLTLEHDARGENASAWPWPFRATQTFDLAADQAHVSLTLGLTLANTGDDSFPFGLGWHPFFPRDSTTTLQFVAREVWINDATELPIQRISASDAWSFSEQRAFTDTPVDNVFTGWNGRATLRSMQRNTVTVIEADSACGCLVVYAPTGHDFVAIEPVSQETDAFNRAATGAQQTGMRMLRPGAAYSCTMRITASVYLP